MSNPVVSVLMPVYNSENFLKEAIESILKQTYKRFEFLILDDGSTDQSSKIIEEYCQLDKRIKFFKSDVNQGLVIQLNRGLEIANGMYIARMDSDDIADKYRLEHQLYYLQQNPNIAVVGSSVEIIDDFGKPLSYNRRAEDYRTLYWRSFFSNPLSHPTVMFRKSVLKEVGGYNSKTFPVEDLALWLEMLKLFEIANINKPLLRYRIHNKSVSSLNNSRQQVTFKYLIENHWKYHLKLKSIDISGLHISFLKADRKEIISREKYLYSFFLLKTLIKAVKKRYKRLNKEIKYDFIDMSLFIALKLKTYRKGQILLTLFLNYPFTFLKFCFKKCKMKINILK